MEFPGVLIKWLMDFLGFNEGQCEISGIAYTLFISKQITFIIYLNILLVSGPVLEINDMCPIFQKQDEKKAKKGKIFENLGKNVQI